MRIACKDAKKEKEARNASSAETSLVLTQPDSRNSDGRLALEHFVN